MKILIAEDELVSQRLLKTQLNKWSYDVEVANNGKEAWEKIHGEDIQLAIIDWIMPEMDGLELCKKIRADATLQFKYIILLTSKDDKKDMVSGLKAGADDYLTKPFDRDELLVRVQVGVRIVNLQRALTQREKLKGVLEMAGATCHELNQPAQAIIGHAELILGKVDKGSPVYNSVSKIKEQVQRMGEVTQKLNNITKYVTKDYIEGTKIIDLDKSSSGG